MIAVFRLPFSEEYLWIEHDPNAKTLAEFYSFDGREKISLASENLIPFSETQLKEKLSNYNIHQEYDHSYPIPSHQEYVKKIEETIGVITQNQLPKLVISRPILKNINDPKLTESFIALSKKYPNTLCYLFFSEEENWMGATPEFLGKYDRLSQDFTTMSLAGTLPTGETWTEKEIEEQKPVTAYILEKLQKYSSNLKSSDTYTHISGNIQHLRTDFEAKIKESSLEDLIIDLHPSPAVCGIPKDFCQDKILEIEQYNRSFYSGYIKIDTPETVFYFVNLRCTKLYKNHAIAFAGGGITEKSIPEKEWKETELKSQAVLSVL